MSLPDGSGVIILYLLYGDFLITDPNTCGFVGSCIENHVPLKVTNMAMGMDPQPGTRKLARLVYLYNGLTHVRQALEFDYLNFALDIVSIKYGAFGNSLDSTYYRDKAHILEPLYRALDDNIPSVADNDTLLHRNSVDDTITDDPMQGTPKQLTITIRHFKTPGRSVAHGTRGEDFLIHEYSFAENETIIFPVHTGIYPIAGTGWIKDDPDELDHMIEMSSLRTATDRNIISRNDFSLTLDRRLKVPVYNQGLLASSTANTVAAAYRYELQRQKGQEFIDFQPSRLWLYYLGRVPINYLTDYLENGNIFDLSMDKGIGTSIRTLLKIIAHKGICPEGPDITDKPDKDSLEFTDGTWPYDGTGYAIKGNDILGPGSWAARAPSEACYTAAQKLIPLHYARVARSVEAWKACISLGYPIIFGFRIYPSFRKMGKDTDWIAPPPRLSRTKKEKRIGGHTVLAVGWNDRKEQGSGCFRIQNSWGDQDADKGFFWMPYDWIYWKSPEELCMLCDDFWTLADVKGLKRDGAALMKSLSLG